MPRSIVSVLNRLLGSFQRTQALTDARTDAALHGPQRLLLLPCFCSVK